MVGTSDHNLRPSAAEIEVETGVQSVTAAAEVVLDSVG
jgi:hypothetical protein